MVLSVAVITISDRAAAGKYEDVSGPLAQELLEKNPGIATTLAIVPDEAQEITAAIRCAHRAGARALITTGGTGIGPRDITPEVTAQLAPKEIPGLMEQIRHRGLQNSPHAGLSRGRAAILYEAESPPAPIVAAPGSPGGVRDPLAVIPPLLAHIVGQLDRRAHA